jgi:glycopeptide antibiotics resistance protein
MINVQSSVKLRWRFGIIAAIVLMVCGMYPQLKMWYLRGADWQGAYAYNDIDEVAYAAYLRALIDGRPRKNDPYTGRDDTPEHPQPESLFSIQFAAPYSVALPARLLGVSASTAMTACGAIAAFLAGLALFWLIGKITNDSLFAMTGAIIVVCGGALAAGEGAIGEILGTGISYPYFPGLRRYVPAIPFAVFFAFCGCVWALVTSQETKKRIFYCVLASLCFSFVVFSYFYIWTAAAAWLFCVVLVWIAVRPENWLNDVKAFVALGVACFIPLAFYALMLSNRSHTMDDVQLLVYTRQPDLLRIPELISYAVIVMLIVAVFIKAINLRDRATLFAMSLALLPLVVFNQQIITGRSLQPIHYQVFIGNYVAGLALIITLGILWSGISRKHPKLSAGLLASLAVIAIAWGIVECHYTVRVLDEANVLRDKGMPVARRLEELSSSDMSSPNSLRGVVMPFSMIQGDDLPTLAPQPVLWARHQHVFAGLTTWQESKDRYYQYLYYMNLDEAWLENSMKNGDYVSMIALFGWGRHSDRLSSNAKPLTYREIEEEAWRFGEYRKNFSFQQASQPTLAYVIVPTDWEADFTNIDAWYERETGEKIGDYTLYKVKLKAQR